MTLRRTPEAEPSDQVVVLARKDQIELEQTGSWDPMGMRGTCSPGFVVRAEFPPEQILPTPFPRVIGRVDGADLPHPLVAPVARHRHGRLRSRTRLRARGRQAKPGEPPPAAMRLSHLMSELSLLRAEVGSGLGEFLAASDERRPRAAVARWPPPCASTTSRSPPPSRRRGSARARSAVCGIMGFKNDTPFSVGRHLRDTMSACLMVANERIHQTNASLLLIAKDV